MKRRASAAAVIAVLVILAAGAAITFALSIHGASTDAAHDLAEGMSCPSCSGQSVAESDSPVAAGMRQTIAQQLSQGRSPAQIRDWFTARYGPEVVRSGASGTPVLMWAIPVVSVAALIIGMTVVRRRRREPRNGGGRVDAAQAHPRLAAGVVGAIVAITVIGVAMGSTAVYESNDAVQSAAASEALAEHLREAQRLEAQGDFTTAADAYRSAQTVSGDPSIRLRQAFALLRAGQPVEAEELARQVRQHYPDSPDALLILGLAQSASGDPAGMPNLSRFLALAPGHPAAPEVARLLESSPR